MSTEDLSTKSEPVMSRNVAVNFQSITQRLDSRIGRLRYLAYSFGVYFFGLLIMSANAAAGSSYPNISILSEIIHVVIIVGMALLFCSQIIRRLNDVDLSGWLMLLAVVPIANLVLAFILLFWPGTAGENRYGPVPEKNSFFVAVIGIFVLLSILNTVIPD